MQNEPINGRTPEEIKRWVDSRVRCDECTNNHEVGCEQEERTKDCKMCIDTLAYIERLEAERDAALVKIPKWISVEERLPDKDGDCVALINLHGDSAEKSLSRPWFIARVYYRKKVGFHWRTGKVTHWMPLPNPPKEG